jgi:hypothetical protein
MTGVGGTLQDWVGRILKSECFRNSPSSRRLLQYLADHASADDAGQLKEYTIGVDAFGKPVGYDPRQDSTVRIQIGRLRKKLFEYYQGEGRDDPMVVALPKGRLTLTCESRPASLEAPAETEEALESQEEDQAAGQPNRWRLAALVLAAVLVAALAWGIPTLSRLRTGASSPWTPELAELWRPFVKSPKPLLISVGDPLFLQFRNKVIYRDPAIEKWEDLVKSPNLEALKRTLEAPESRPVHYYAAVGDVNAAFLLGQRLGPHQPGMSLFRSSQLLWQQMADANVLFLGPPRFFVERLESMPLALEIVETPEGFRNVHPRPGEQERFPYRDPAGFFTEDGEAVVLVTHAAGPAGNSDILTFASNSTFARLGAVSAFTDPAFARTLVSKLRASSAGMPRYFQVLLRVRYKGGVPTETAHLLHRELRRRE